MVIVEDNALVWLLMNNWIYSYGVIKYKQLQSFVMYDKILNFSNSSVTVSFYFSDTTFICQGDSVPFISIGDIDAAF